LGDLPRQRIKPKGLGGAHVNEKKGGWEKFMNLLENLVLKKRRIIGRFPELEENRGGGAG